MSWRKDNEGRLQRRRYRFGFLGELDKKSERNQMKQTLGRWILGGFGYSFDLQLKRPPSKTVVSCNHSQSLKNYSCVSGAKDAGCTQAEVVLPPAPPVAQWLTDGRALDDAVVWRNSVSAKPKIVQLYSIRFFSSPAPPLAHSEQVRSVSMAATLTSHPDYFAFQVRLLSADPASRALGGGST